MGLAGFMKDWWWVAGAPVFVGLALLASFVSPFLLPDLQVAWRTSGSRRRRARYERIQDLPDIPVKVRGGEGVHRRAQRRGDRPRPDPAGDPLGHAGRRRLHDGPRSTSCSPTSSPTTRATTSGSFGWFALIALPLAFVIALATRGRGGMYCARRRCRWRSSCWSCSSCSSPRRRTPSCATTSARRTGSRSRPPASPDAARASLRAPGAQEPRRSRPARLVGGAAREPPPIVERIAMARRLAARGPVRAPAAREWRASVARIASPSATTPGGL